MSSSASWNSKPNSVRRISPTKLLPAPGRPNRITSIRSIVAPRCPPVLVWPAWPGLSRSWSYLPGPAGQRYSDRDGEQRLLSFDAVITNTSGGPLTGLDLLAAVYAKTGGLVAAAPFTVSASEGGALVAGDTLTFNATLLLDGRAAP